VAAILAGCGGLTFNLHTRADGSAEARFERKPTADDIVTAVEFYDQASEQIISCTGKRKPGQAEVPAWRDLVALLFG
jgi:putative hemin transport protein